MVNNSELNALLQHLRVPERAPEEWAQLASAAARQAYASRSFKPPLERSPGRRNRMIAAWGLGFAVCCLLLGFLVGRWQGGRETHQDEIANARKLFSELNALFPDQIEAVILNESGPRLILAEKPTVRDSAPLYVRICGELGCERIITFSGGQFPLNGQTLDVLEDVRGNVIVAGERFVWTSDQPRARVAGLEIDAAPLRL